MTSPTQPMILDAPLGAPARPRLLDAPIGPLPRILLVIAALLLAPTYLFPLWNLTMFAPQYPEGLRLDIYSYQLTGGNEGQDVKEINLLNHYIGMRDLQAEDFTEFKWMPFVIGALGLLFLRAAVHGQLAQTLDVLVLCLYFSLFSLWSFAYKLYRYGNDLAPTAAVRVDPFMPPLFGHERLANFDVYSYPAFGSYALAAAIGVLAVAFFLAWWRGRRRVAEA
jgi:hypothetical protein